MLLDRLSIFCEYLLGLRRYGAAERRFEIVLQSLSFGDQFADVGQQLFAIRFRTWGGRPGEIFAPVRLGMHLAE